MTGLYQQQFYSLFLGTVVPFDSSAVAVEPSFGSEMCVHVQTFYLVLVACSKKGLVEV